MQVFAINIQNYSYKDMYRFISILTEDEKIKLFKLKMENDKLRFFSARLLLRYLLKTYYNINPYLIGFFYNEFGKPFLANNQDIFFNISHSANWVLCGVDNKPLGIDIEEINDIDLNISNEFFSNDENGYLKSLDLENQLYSFYLIWTLKESYIKFIGKGLSIPLNSFTIIPNKLDLVKLNSDICSLNLKSYNFDVGYVCSICTSEDFLPEYLKYISLNEIIKKLCF